MSGNMDGISDNLGVIDVTKAPKKAIIDSLMGDAAATMHFSEPIIDEFVEKFNIWMLEENRAFNTTVEHVKEQYTALVQQIMFEMIKKKCHMAGVTSRDLAKHVVEDIRGRN